MVNSIKYYFLFVKQMTKSLEITFTEEEDTISHSLIDINQQTTPLNAVGYCKVTASDDGKGKTTKIYIVKNDFPTTRDPMGLATALCGVIVSGLCAMLLLSLLDIIPVTYIAIGVINVCVYLCISIYVCCG